ncbi:MAG: creatinine amidohydrolase [Planctomycetota bacterium]|nr:MAG: creatinine amidohydrolase [Planctomycetota bacterium]
MTDLAKLSWTGVEALLARGCAAILPVGATEAHGPHLPLDTDVTIALGMSRRAATTLQARGQAAVVLPPLAYSLTDWAAPFSGTLGLTADEARTLLLAVLRGAARTGFRPLAIANGHLEAGHVAVLREVAATIQEETGVPVAFPDVTRRRLAERLTDEFRSGACHAGRYEGSLVLADDPQSVDDDAAAKLPPVNNSLVDAHRAGAQNFVEAGGPLAYFGAPAEASAEEGRATFELLATMLVESIDEVSS